ncbi:TonB-dependent receptor plug domain-containing protein [Pedomonas mirosovicensis]|uniref:TonB-dependent receptor plug domain-containing protein n=1 Tax=Pedomonas mirosovicensis TaxID=2908641 RepID=UPI00216A7662|nr:TonB-dependent receptor [Pedomonas mirosovicensis]MCH8686470.1 TonB-dependent receptor [Pedomonas mirosovicensis]
MISLCVSSRSVYRNHASRGVVALMLLAAVASGRASAQSQDVGIPQSGSQAGDTPNDVEPAAGIGPDTARPVPQDHYLEFKQIVVTGSNIRGIGISAGSPLTIIGRPEIESSGYATTQQILQLLPQNFGGGAAEDTSRGAEAISTLKRRTSGINLRGLGNVATLVLLNGRRMIGASDNGDIPDISLIPTSALERIEILPDGASAVYGSDAVAGVVNFILRSDYEGAETTLRYGSSTEGGVDEYQAAQTFGFKWNGGNLLLTGEYYHRDRLDSADRDFAATSDLTARGGTNWSNFYSVPGNIINPATFTPAFAIPPGQDGRNLTAADLLPGQTNFFNTRQGVDLLPRQNRYNVFGRANQELNPDLKIFAEVFFAQRKAKYHDGSQIWPVVVTPANPFWVDAFGTGQPVIVAYNFYNDRGAEAKFANQKTWQSTAGLTYDVAGDWRVNGYFTYAKSIGHLDLGSRLDQDELAAALIDPNRETALNVFGDGSANNPETIARIFSDDSYQDRVRSRYWAVNLFADGTVFEVPGGPMKVGFGGELRRERLRSVVDVDTSRFNRRVAAAFGELYVPFVGPRNAMPGIEALNVSFSLRAEKYDDKELEPVAFKRDDADTINPKIGMNWTVTPGLILQATYGTAFRAPSLGQLAQQKSLSFGPVNDPRSPTGTTQALFISGTQPDLENETADTWTLGAVIAPPSIPMLRLQGTYYNISFTNRITGAAIPTEMIANEDQYAEFITRNPSLAQLQAACAGAVLGFTPPVVCTTPDLAGVIIDLRTGNRARYTTEGLDLAASYTIDTDAAGQFNLMANANYVFNLKQSPTRVAPAIPILDTFSNPVELRVRGGVAWTSNFGLSAHLFANYTDSYRNNLAITDEKISSHTTFDLTLTYLTGDRPGTRWLRDIAVSFSATNLFDNDPPFVDVSGGYDPENFDPLGRFLSLTITKSW